MYKKQSEIIVAMLGNIKVQCHLYMDTIQSKNIPSHILPECIFGKTCTDYYIMFGEPVYNSDINRYLNDRLTSLKLLTFT